MRLSSRLRFVALCWYGMYTGCLQDVWDLEVYGKNTKIFLFPWSVLKHAFKYFIIWSFWKFKWCGVIMISYWKSFLRKSCLWFRIFCLFFKEGKKWIFAWTFWVLENVCVKSMRIIYVCFNFKDRFTLSQLLKAFIYNLITLRIKSKI